MGPRRFASPAAPISALGWFVVACLVGWVLLGGLRPTMETAFAIAGPGPLVVDDLEAHWRSFADNEVHLFVRGRLLNVSDQPQVVGESLRVLWLDEAGSPLGGGAAATGLAERTDQLASLDAEARAQVLRVAAVDLASVRLSAGEGVAFAAVVPDGPQGARRVDVRWLPRGAQPAAAGHSFSVAGSP